MLARRPGSEEYSSRYSSDAMRWRFNNHRARRWPARLVSIASILAGIVVLVFPVGEFAYNDRQQAEMAEKSFSQRRDALQVGPGGPTSETVDSEEMTRARAYNATVHGLPLLDPWTVSGQDQSPRYREYLDQLAGGSTMARVRVPGLGINQPVRHGTSDRVLESGLGHLYGTALPVGGSGTHSVVVGHSGLRSSPMLDRLPEARIGELIFVDVEGQTLTYRIDQITVVLPDQIDSLRPEAGADLITLITCVPYAVNTHRILVRGSRVPTEKLTSVERDQANDNGLGMNLVVHRWMVPRLTAASVAAGLLVLLVAGWGIADIPRAKRRSACGQSTNTN